MLSTAEILKRYLSFFKNQNHTQIANSPLVLVNDPTTLFTSSGMQPLVPYLLGEEHPMGKRLVNVQNCFRSQDIDEIGDNRHTTFFRMLGNWSLGDYFKKEQLPWFFEFLTSKEEGLGLDPTKLYVTAFEGNDQIPKDEESAAIWKKLFEDKGISTENRIFFYGATKNWWSRSGTPDKMPAGEPGGPDSEVFYEFTNVQHDPKFGDKCHPNCDCGRFMEIGNSVFMQYQKQEDGSFKELPNKNVDFGGGLERFACAVNDQQDVFQTDLYKEVITTIEETSDRKYDDNKSEMRVIADHVKAAVFLIVDNVKPSNKEQGYILRRLLRRAAVKMYQLKGGLTPANGFQGIADRILEVEENIDENLDHNKHRDLVFTVIQEEMTRFSKSLEKGLKEIEKSDSVKGKEFYFYQSFGFPIEIIEELAHQKGQEIDKASFTEELQKHKELSKTASAGMFKGGLADHQEKTIMGHTATHLLHQALRDVLGNHVHQTGSNITTERIRFDFNYEQKLTEDELQKVEKIVNEKIKLNLPVHYEMIDTQKAKEMGAIGLFMDTYGDKSKIYFIGGSSDNPKEAYSIEFCGGPHVDFTGKLKSFKIQKQENLGHGQKRIYSIVEA